jgi:hypothetical protein
LYTGFNKSTNPVLVGTAKTNYSAPRITRVGKLITVIAYLHFNNTDLQKCKNQND